MNKLKNKDKIKEKINRTKWQVQWELLLILVRNIIIIPLFITFGDKNYGTVILQ